MNIGKCYNCGHINNISKIDVPLFNTFNVKCLLIIFARAIKQFDIIVGEHRDY